jgi:Ca2+/Na+ antiporter
MYVYRYVYIDMYIYIYLYIYNLYFLGKYPSATVKPIYNYKEYKKIKIIQKYVKLFLKKQRIKDIVNERKRLELAEIAREDYLKAFREGSKYTVKIDIKIYDIILKNEKMLSLGYGDTNNEYLLNKFELYPAVISPGVWALLQTTDKKLEIVVMFNIVDR